MTIHVYLPNEVLLQGPLREMVKLSCENARASYKEAAGSVWDLISIDAQAKSSEPFEFLVILEAHCNFSAMSQFANTLLTTVIPPNARGAFILASHHFDSPTPELDNGQGETLQLISNMRHSQFYIRMFESYGWSTFTHAEYLNSLLLRIATLKGEYLRFTNNSLQGWQDDVRRIKEEIDNRLNLGVWANTLRPTISTNGWEGSEKLSRVFFPGISGNILESLALTHQFGRLNSPDSEGLISRSGIKWFTRDILNERHIPGFSPPHLRNLFQESTTKSRDLWETSSGRERNNSPDLHKQLVHNAGARNIVRASQFVFELLRDCSQMLSKGTAVWAQDAAATKTSATRTSGDRQTEEPLRVLAIKDRIRGNHEQQHTEELFRSAFKAGFRPGTLDLDCIEYTPEGENQPWDTHKWWLDRVEGRVKTSVKRDSGGGAPEERLLLTYDIILIEAEYSNRFVGPSIIQWLDHVFDEARSRPTFRRPQLFVLSRDENAGHSFMCLWLGAQAFASKSRIFGIPSLLTMANVRGSANDPDQKRLRPNYYAMEGLLPHQKNRLQSLKRREVIHGDEWDRNWIRKLPKADLHYHIGTSISLDAIKTLAVNTVGHMIDSVDDYYLNISHTELPPLGKVLGGSEHGPVITEAILNACKVALLYAVERTESNLARSVDPYRHLWGAARFVLLPTDKFGRVVSRDAPEFNALDAVVQWLVRKDRPVRSHEACAILVTAITVLECLGNGNDAESAFGQKVYSNWLAFESASRPLRDQLRPNSLGSYLDTQLFYLLERIAENWKDNYTGESIGDIAREVRATETGSRSNRFLTRVSEACLKRAIKVFVVFKRAFEMLSRGETSKWLYQAEIEFNKRGAEPMFSHITDLSQRSIDAPGKLFDCEKAGKNISLEEIVALPVSPEGESANGSLKRYLVGCDLLGAEHLQYPENILLAACDITRQNAEDNVVYSELRCATTGYSRGGMSVIDATDLLCRGFDLGAVFFGSLESNERISAGKAFELLNRYRGEATANESLEFTINKWQLAPRRWIRSNILLGAKRHKAGDIENVVSLVVQYLDRGPEFWNRQPDGTGKELQEPGHWWKMCSVAGFDLSGNEAAEISNLELSIKRLFAACSPVTIHAGEAMSADSIWEAVYKLNAQRIGHGLRLRDDSRLLEHCVRNGICMELCPVSNSFTNSFSPIVRPEIGGPARRNPGRKRDEYPILDFLDAGLDVCLNTDNRSIHPNRNTLTDEYLRAAKLSGGLTKWEVLRITKAGFKNAFIAKDDVALLLRHVEYEIYKIVCEHSGEKRFPQVERFNPVAADD